VKVIVIGAGAAGLAIGWRLVQAGADVTVVERAQPGRGATWAAAGLISAPEQCETGLARRAAELWPDFAQSIEQASGRAIAYTRNGGLFLAMTSEDAETMGSRGDEMLSPAAAREIEPRLSPELAGALWMANEAKVDNRALGRALAAAFGNAGGSLSLNETVVRFEMRDDRIVGVRTPFAFHQADRYVLAAGAWSGQLEGLPVEALPPVFPAKGEMIALEPPEGENLPRPSISGADIYMLAQRGRLLVGATVQRVGFDSSLTTAASEWLMERAQILMPSLAGWNLVEHWAGLRPGSPDDLPIVGRSILNELFIASGQFRNGILYTPAIAEVICALVLGKDSPVDIAPFDPRRFAGRGGEISA
jgi:glycine oxidase